MIGLSIDEFFTAIKDGEWHHLDELSDQIGLSASKLTKLSKLLSRQGLIDYDEKTSNVTIRPLWKLLLPAEEEANEPKSTVVTFIIPPKGSIDVQSTHFSNTGETELEVSLRIDNKIKEVAIKP